MPLNLIEYLRLFLKISIKKKKDKILEFLAIETILMNNSSYKIRLIFAGDSVITVFAEEIDTYLDDLGQSWNVKKVPRHKI